MCALGSEVALSIGLAILPEWLEDRWSVIWRLDGAG
jgi:hypothetical protein